MSLVVEGVVPKVQPSERRRKPGRPCGIIEERHLAEQMAQLTSLSLDQLKFAVPRLKSICRSALYWAETSGKVVRTRKIAQLLHLAGEDDSAISLLENLREISPRDEKTILLLSEIFSSRENWWQAVQALSRFVGDPTADCRTLVAAAQLYWRAGDIERSLQLYERAASKEPRYRTDFIRMLVKSDRRELLLIEADKILGESAIAPSLCLALYTALLQVGADIERTLNVRRLALRSAGEGPSSAIWRARIMKADGNILDGLEELKNVPAALVDEKITIERAKFVLGSGTWGLNAQCLLAAKDSAASGTPLFRGIELADEFLKECGGSLRKAAEDPIAFAHIKSPESAFDLLINRLPNSPKPRGTGLVVIVPSLACGGAERIVAHTTSKIIHDPRFAWTKLYALDISSENHRDFYLRNTGLSRSDVTLIQKSEELERPWAWLGSNWGPRVQSIFKLLEKDKPGAVHATLDFMNIPAGLAALAAGVPRIVLHVHNMAPRKTSTEPDTLRHIYRALLQRPEVTLVGCGQICLDDYADWLDLRDKNRLKTVRNGAETKRISNDSSRSARATTREVLGFRPDTPVIGTAIRFVDLKQPFLWVNAAEAVLAREPDCMFLMLGDGELHKAIQDHIRGKNLAGRFVLPGVVKNVYPYLSAMDLFVLSSRSEALPNSLVEAQAAGVPVIAFDVGGVRETMLEGITGRLVRDQSEGALADCIVEALRDSRWRYTASDAARRFVSETFSNKRMVESLCSILLAGRSQPQLLRRTG
jgi:glycosyltransferase involved in cell wall biosynthesis